MGWLSKASDWLNPMNASVGGSTVGGALEKALPTTKGFNKNAVSAMQHPLSFATGGLLGGKGGTFEVPHFSGGSTTNALSGSDQYGHSANKNRAIAAIIGTVLGGEALAGGDSAGAGAGAESGALTDPVVTNAALPAGGMTSTGGLSAGDAAAIGEGTSAGSGVSAIPAVESGGSGSLMGSIGNGLKSYGPLAMSAVNMLKGSAPTDAQNQQSGISATQLQVGNQLISQYNSGQLNAGDSYNVAQWEQQQTQSVKDYYAKAGLGDSSMAQQAIAGIDR